MYRFESKDTEEWFAKFTLHRPLFLTLGFNDHVKYDYGEKVKERMKLNHKHFLKKLHKFTYAKSKRKIPRYAVIERGGKTKGMHSHMLIENPEHLSQSQFKQLCSLAWNSTKDGVSVQFEECYFRKGLDSYNSKQQRHNNNNAMVDVENCYMNNNLDG